MKTNEPECWGNKVWYWVVQHIWFWYSETHCRLSSPLCVFSVRNGHLLNLLWSLSLSLSQLVQTLSRFRKYQHPPFFFLRRETDRHSSWLYKQKAVWLIHAYTHIYKLTPARVHTSWRTGRALGSILKFVSVEKFINMYTERDSEGIAVMKKSLCWFSGGRRVSEQPGVSYTEMKQVINLPSQGCI